VIKHAAGRTKNIENHSGLETADAAQTTVIKIRSTGKDTSSMQSTISAS